MPDFGNTSVFFQVDGSNLSGTMPSWNGSALPSTIDDAGRAFQGAATRDWYHRSFTQTATGTADVKVLTYTVAPAALYTGEVYNFIANTTNTTTVTLNINTLGAKTIKKEVNGVATVLAAGEMVAGMSVSVYYNGTDFIWFNRGNLDGYAALAVANTFDADQTIRSFDTGATAGPILYLDRISASPAASDLMGAWFMRGRNLLGSTISYVTGYSVLLDPTTGSEDSEFRLQTQVAGAGTDQIQIANGIKTPGATGSYKGSGTANFGAVYDDGDQIFPNRILLVTLTTTSGTTQTLTGIASTYKRLYCQIEAVSFSAAVTMQLAVSQNNGVSYGTAQNISVNTGSAAGVIFGNVTIDSFDVPSTSYCVATGITGITSGTATVINNIMAGNGGAGGPFNAIQFSGGTFDAGTIKIWGEP
jgi:hypothetical protein